VPHTRTRPAIGAVLGRLSLLMPMLLALLLACATSPSPAPPVAAAPSIRPVPLSGTYNGVMQLVSGAAMSCGNQDILALTVANDALSYTLNQPQVPWKPVRSFDVTIASDGSFQAQSGAAYIRGTVSAGHMAGDIIGDACGYHFEADRSGTW